MTEYNNENRGALFVSDRKKTDRDPDYRGTINIGGKDFFLNGWKKLSAAGNEYLSLSAKEKPTKPAATKTNPIFGREVGF